MNHQALKFAINLNIDFNSYLPGSITHLLTVLLMIEELVDHLDQFKY